MLCSAAYSNLFAFLGTHRESLCTTWNCNEGVARIKMKNALLRKSDDITGVVKQMSEIVHKMSVQFSAFDVLGSTFYLPTQPLCTRTDTLLLLHVLSPPLLVPTFSPAPNFCHLPSLCGHFHLLPLTYAC